MDVVYGLTQCSILKALSNISQGRAFICGSKCCDNTFTSAEEVQRCIEQCQRPLLETQSLVKQGNID